MLLTAVAAVALPVTGGDVAPGQVLDLGVQAGLVLLHDQDVMGALAGDQELGVFALGVQGIGGDHGSGQSSGASNGRNWVISLVLPSTLAWASTALAC